MKGGALGGAALAALKAAFAHQVSDRQLQLGTMRPADRGNRPGRSLYSPRGKKSADGVGMAYPDAFKTVLMEASGVESKEDVAHILGDSAAGWRTQFAVWHPRCPAAEYENRRAVFIAAASAALDNLPNIITDQEELDATAALDCYMAKADSAFMKRFAEGILSAAALDLANALAGADKCFCQLGSAKKSGEGNTTFLHCQIGKVSVPGRYGIIIGEASLATPSAVLELGPWPG
ncbi:hypothetical protein HDU89_000056 [Geranomyces variabilis]|nr:hypothetical protein HDU89_000056 [Geranomyces variabilis]